MESKVVPLKWAQHKKVVFLTLDAKNLSDEGRSITLTPEGHLHFEGTNKITRENYKIELNLFEEVVVETSKWKVTDFCVHFCVSKKNQDAEFWPRLTKEKVKLNFVSVDWARWVDEDEADNKNLDYNPDDFDNLPDDMDDDDDDDQEEKAVLDDLEDKEEEEKKDSEENKE